MADDGGRWRVGAHRRPEGAAQHNGKVGRLKGRVGEDRLGVELDDGVVLSIKRANLELVPPKPAASSSGATVTDLEKNQRTLKREPGLLDEFHGSQDPDTLVLYHHLRDQAFDCFNATEYAVQMLQYYGAGLEVVEVVPRKLGADEYALVCRWTRSTSSGTRCAARLPVPAPFSDLDAREAEVLLVRRARRRANAHASSSAMAASRGSRRSGHSTTSCAISFARRRRR